MKYEKVAVIFIGTDKYLNFLPEWYNRCEENFLPTVQKQYFVCQTASSDFFKCKTS